MLLPEEAIESENQGRKQPDWKAKPIYIIMEKTENRKQKIENRKQLPEIYAERKVNP